MKTTSTALVSYLISTTALALGCSESVLDLSSVGSSVRGLSLANVASELQAPVLPKLPKSPLKPINPPVLQLCPTSPDLQVEALQFTHAQKDWVYVCAPIKNVGGVAWSSQAAQVVGNISSDKSPRSASFTGFASLAKGASITRCAWLSMPGLIRTGHDTAQFGECRATANVTLGLTYDPDIRIDGNTANDDCKASNDQRTAPLNYMVACPW